MENLLLIVILFAFICICAFAARKITKLAIKAFQPKLETGNRCEWEHTPLHQDNFGRFVCKNCSKIAYTAHDAPPDSFCTQNHSHAKSTTNIPKYLERLNPKYEQSRFG